MVKGTRSRGTPAFFAKSLHANDPYGTVEGQGHYITDAYLLAGGGHSLAIQTHVPSLRQRGSVAAGAHHARMPQPSIDPLVLRICCRGGQDGSLAPCSSCCLRAASLANGELGSGCFSRLAELLPNGLA